MFVGHCRRRIRSAWTVRTPHHQTRQGPYVGRLRPRWVRRAPPPAFYRRCSAGPYGSSGWLYARSLQLCSPCVTTALPDDARFRSSFRRRPFHARRTRRSAFNASAAAGAVGSGFVPGAQWSPAPSPAFAFLVAPAVVGRRRVDRRFTTGPLSAPPAAAGLGRSAMPSIGLGGSRLNRLPIRPRLPIQPFSGRPNLGRLPWRWRTAMRTEKNRRDRSDSRASFRQRPRSRVGWVGGIMSSAVSRASPKTAATFAPGAGALRITVATEFSRVAARAALSRR